MKIIDSPIEIPNGFEISMEGFYTHFNQFIENVSKNINCVQNSKNCIDLSRCMIGFLSYNKDSDGIRKVIDFYHCFIHMIREVIKNQKKVTLDILEYYGEHQDEEQVKQDLIRRFSDLILVAKLKSGKDEESRHNYQSSNYLISTSASNKRKAVALFQNVKRCKEFFEIYCVNQ